VANCLFFGTRKRELNARFVAVGPSLIKQASGKVMITTEALPSFSDRGPRQREVADGVKLARISWRRWETLARHSIEARPSCVLQGIGLPSVFPATRPPIVSGARWGVCAVRNHLGYQRADVEGSNAIRRWVCRNFRRQDPRSTRSLKPGLCRWPPPGRVPALSDTHAVRVSTVVGPEYQGAKVMVNP